MEQIFSAVNVSINELRRRFPHISEDVLRLSADAGVAGLRPTAAQQPKGRSLVRAPKRKVSRSLGAKERYRVIFTVHAVRPPDWDNAFIKSLQDCLVTAGLLPSDDYGSLEGSVISKKVQETAQEKTTIEIIRIA